MKVLNVEEVGKTKRKVTLQIDPEDIREEAEEAYETLGKETEMPGFRKGRVPRRFLEYRFDKEIQKEAFNESVQHALEEAVKENELRTVGRPDIDEKELDAAREKIVEGPTEISVTLEIIPVFELPPYKGNNLEIEPFEVTDETVNHILESQREGQAFYSAVDERPTKEGDFVVVGVRSTRKGEEVPPLTSNQMLVSGLCTGASPKAFDEGLLNLNKGDRFEYDFELDPDHPLYEEGGDNTVHVEGKIQQINDRTLPNLDDEFAKDMGHEDLEEYRNAIRRQLEGYRGAALSRRKAARIVESLLEKTDVTVPTSLIQSRYLTMKYRRQMGAAQAGEDEAYLTAEAKSQLEVRTMIEAEREAKRELILSKIAEKEGMTVSDDEYYGAMRAQAQARGETNLDRYLADIDREGLEDVYKDSLLMSKVTHWLVQHNEFEVVKQPGA